MDGKLESTQELVSELLAHLLHRQPIRSNVLAPTLAGTIDGEPHDGAELVALIGEIGRSFDVGHSSWPWGTDHVLTFAQFFDRAPNSKAKAGQPRAPVGGAAWIWQVVTGQIVRIDMHARALPAPGRHLAQILVDIFYRFGASIVAAALFAVLVNTSQSREVLLLAAGVPGSRISYSLLSDSIAWSLVPAFMIVCHGAFAVTRTSEHPVLPGRMAGHRLWWPPVNTRALALPALIAAVIPGAISLALFRASFATGQVETVVHLRIWSVFHGLFALFFVGAGVAMAFARAERNYGKAIRQFVAVPTVVFLLLMLGFLVAPNDGLKIAPARFILAAGVLIGLLAIARAIGDRQSAPGWLGRIGAALVPALTTWIVAMAWFGWDDHHFVRSLPPAQTRADYNGPIPPPSPLPVAADFRAWLEARYTPGKPFPAIIVATEGGGIRAAVMTAMVLDELRAKVPGFNHHLYAIVGVSGGSLGAAAYAAALAAQPMPRPAERLAVMALSGRGADWQASLHADLLSPTIDGLMTGDLVTRVWPTWLGDVSRFDRARALERSWTDAWVQATGDDIADLAFDELRPGPWQDQPRLVLMTTSVHDGTRVAVSHFEFGPDPERPATCRDASIAVPATLTDIAPTVSVPLATAAFMSARFPIITPPARISTPGGGSIRVVDGGYYENSGLTTVADIISGIRCGADGRAPIVVIRIENGGADEEQINDAKDATSLVDVSAAIEALYRSRTAHGNRAAAGMDGIVAAAKSSAPGCPLITQQVFKLRRRAVPLPLGWFISPPAVAEIAQQLQGSDNAHAFARVSAALTCTPNKPTANAEARR